MQVSVYSECILDIFTNQTYPLCEIYSNIMSHWNASLTSGVLLRYMTKANYASMFQGQKEDYSTIFYNGGLLKQLQNGKLYIEYNKMFFPCTILISRPESFFN